MEITTAVHRFTVRENALPVGGARQAAPAADARTPGLRKVRSARIAELYFVRGTIAPGELMLLGRVLFGDPVTETWECGAIAAPEAGVRVLETAYRPGVTDPVAEEIVRAARELGIPGLEAAATGRRYEFLCGTGPGQELTDAELSEMAERLYANPVIQRYAIGEIEPAFPETAAASHSVEMLEIGGMDDVALLSLSKARRAALDIAEMRAVRDYFRREGRACTDVEFEAIAQTWSEHCVHKTFKALIELRDGASGGLPERVDNILKTYIKSVTDELAAPWVLSAFTDNAGILEFDDEYEISFKVETHNHPSAIEPFGGANTGVGGVIRDIMGVSAKPVAVTDVLCFGLPDTPGADVPNGVAHPSRIREGVISGVQDYGNKMGIPTVNGGIHYHPGYTANPLVYCGCAGLAPRGMHRNTPRAGDRVVALGGRTGRDGIRGATFSSMPMDHTTQELSGSSVQIGAPITEKKTSEVILAARDACLYTAVTDCGAGGLSSAVGEMSAELGADIELDAVTLKYPGLAPWEIWLSEAQERMVIAVPPANMQALASICEEGEVELFDLGVFTGTGRLVVRKSGAPVLDLECAFLHGGLPQRKLVAAAPAPASGAAQSIAGANIPDCGEALRAILGHHAVSSRESVIRRYDHEVQGATRLGPFSGDAQRGPSDAAVIKPTVAKGARAFALSNGFNCRYGEADAYRAAVSAVDEAVRNAVAVGADPDRIAVLDNFCWGDPEKPETMWTLLQAARGCRDAALAHRTPFVSGKDSFNNEYTDRAGKRVSIPSSLLISAIGIVPDVGRTASADLKQAGDALYIVGDFSPAMRASVYADVFGGAPGEGPEDGPPAASPNAPAVYRALHVAIRAGLVPACHDLSDGGLSAAAAEMCLSGGLGADLDAVGLCAGGGVPAVLFGETNGCLIAEVPPERAAEFETVFAGLPCARIGEVSVEPRLRIACPGGATYEWSVDALADSFGAGREEA